MCQMMFSFEQVNGAGQPGLKGEEVWGYVGGTFTDRTFSEKVLYESGGRNALKLFEDRKG